MRGASSIRILIAGAAALLIACAGGKGGASGAQAGAVDVPDDWMSKDAFFAGDAANPQMCAVGWFPGSQPEKVGTTMSGNRGRAAVAKLFKTTIEQSSGGDTAAAEGSCATILSSVAILQTKKEGDKWYSLACMDLNAHRERMAESFANNDKTAQQFFPNDEERQECLRVNDQVIAHAKTKVAE